MKSITLSQKLLLLIYLIGSVILGSLTADQEFIAVFEGNQIFIWYSLLTIYYGVILLLTIWIVSYLTQLFYKLANKDAFDRAHVTSKSIWLILIALYAHILILYIDHFLYSGAELLLLFVIPVAILLITIARDMKIQGFKKVIAIIPLIGYIGFDVISLYALM